MIHSPGRPSLAQLRQALAGTEQMAAISTDPLANELVEKLKAHISDRENEDEDAQDG